jgi:hypothetical protein
MSHGLVCCEAVRRVHNQQLANLPHHQSTSHSIFTQRTHLKLFILNLILKVHHAQSRLDHCPHMPPESISASLYYPTAKPMPKALGRWSTWSPYQKQYQQALTSCYSQSKLCPIAQSRQVVFYSLLAMHNLTIRAQIHGSPPQINKLKQSHLTGPYHTETIKTLVTH